MADETAIAFNNVGSISGSVDGPDILSSPTNVQFGPDGRLYVTEQRGMINALTIEVQAGRYVATAVEEINDVLNIQNHNDDGSLYSPSQQERQITGMLVAGTAENPVLYVSSSDPRIGTDFDKNLDTNSGVLSRLTWNGSSWDAVDLVRGLPRSEENHAVNGIAMSQDGTALYLLVGSNTNAGAPSSGFVYTAEYALNATLLEIDLEAIDALPTLIDDAPGLNNGRAYVYDLPTLDDPNTPNNGVREDASGMDTAGPWGGRDGLNQAVLPADAPLRVHSTGLRNAYDLAMTEDGRLYTVDNGWNQGFGDVPVVVDGEATNLPNDGGFNDGEPLFLLEDGGYYGFPNPTRSNQDQSWTVRDDDGNPDATVPVNFVEDISALVPAGVDIAPGFLIDPSKFTGDPARLAAEGVAVPRISAESNALVVLGSSSNGLVEYTADNFGGALQGDLLVAQFNGNVARLNLNAAGTDAVYETVPGLSGLSTPLDVAMGPDGTIWVAEIFGDRVSVFAPTDIIVPGNPDTDGDGLLNVVDPFIRDAANGGLAFVLPNRTLVWDFDANIDGNRPGPGGYGAGLTGAMVDGVTDYDAFYNEPADFPLQDIKLDNMKFATAAAGGAIVVENASTGDATAGANSGEYLFHAGATVAATVERFTLELTAINPFGELDNGGPNQQIGAYLGTGDQSNFLKLVAVDNGAAGGQIEFGLEDNDVYAFDVLDAPGLLTAPAGAELKFELLIDRIARTATPTVIYETSGGSNSVTGETISIAGSNVEQTINGDWTVNGETTGLAAGLYASNVGQSAASSFQAVFTDMQIVGEGSTDGLVLYRVNAGGEAVAATDGGPNWTVNTAANPGAFMTQPGGNLTKGAGNNQADATLPSYVPQAVYQSERYDTAPPPSMSFAFPVAEPGLYEVRLFVGSSFSFLESVNETIFDIRVEGVLDSAFDNIDPVALFGFREVGMLSAVFEVRDGVLDMDFIHDAAWNPTVNGVEILQLATFDQTISTLSLQPPDPQSAQELANDGATTLIFPLVFDRRPVSPVTVTYDVTINGVTVVSDGVANVGFEDSFIAVPVPNDAVDNGPEDVQVTLTGVTAGSNGTVLGQIAATGTVTEDDAVSGQPAALVQVKPGQGNFDTSTFLENSLIITNTGDVEISTISFNIGGAVLPDVVFDPQGTAGDPGGRGIRVSTTSDAVGFVAPADPDLDPFSVPHNGVDAEDGFEVVTLSFTDFGAGERFLFGVDIDPTSIKGTSSPTGIGSVSGLELVGSTVTIAFEDGSVLTSSLFEEGTNGGSDAVVAPSAPTTAPGLVLTGVSTPGVVPGASQTLRVTGPAGQSVTVLQIDARLASPEAGFVFNDLDPFEANQAIARATYSATIGSGGFVDIPVTLQNTPKADGLGDGGLNHFVAVINGAGGQTSATSNVVVVDLQPGTNAPPSIASIGDVTVTEGQTASFVVSATDADGDVPSLSVSVERGDGSVVSPSEYVFADNGDGTGSFSWATDAADDGTYAVTVVADDGQAQTTETLTLTVNDTGGGGGGGTLTVRAGGNGTTTAPPQFEVFADGVSLGVASIVNPKSTPGFAVNDDSLFRDYTFDFAGASPGVVEIDYFNDGTTDGVNRDLVVDYIVLGGTVYESETDGVFTPDNGNPVFGGAREKFFVDGVLTFDGLPSGGGGGTNAPPSIASIGDVTVTEGQTASFVVSATDADGDVPSLSVSVERGDGSVVSPSEYVFADNGDGTGSFSWATDAADDGTYAVTVVADDGQAQTTETLTLTVNDTGGGGGGGTLTVRAGGNGTTTAPPQFEVFADGVSLGVASIVNPKSTPGFAVNDDSLFRDYTFDFAGASPGVVEIDYFNDGTTDGVNRDLVVDYIVLGGTVYESETDGVFTPDNGNPVFGGAREKFFVDGVLTFDGLPSGGGGGTNAPPSIASIGDVTVTEGQTASFVVSATDADGDVPSLSVSVERGDGSVVSPSEYVFVDNGDGTGSFSWATDAADDGTYAVTVVADDGQAQTTETLTLTVNDTGGGGGGGTLTVRAGGNGTTTAPPQFEVFADGVSLGVASIVNPKSTPGFAVNDDSLFRDYTFDFAGASPGVVEIDYFNDGTTDGVNRDLVVDYIVLGGTVYESETDGVFTPDNGNPVFGGAREKFFVDGVLTFDGLPSGGGGTGGGSGGTEAAEQFHLAWTDDAATTMTAVWRLDATAAATDARHRAVGEQAWETVESDARSSGTMGGELREATFSSLEPDREYELQVRLDDESWSQSYEVRTAPMAGEGDFTAVFFADTGLIGRPDGLDTGTEQVRDEIAKLDPTLLLGGGDYAYFNSDKRFGDLDSTIDAWFDQWSSVLSQAPFMTTYGNHEVSSTLDENFEDWRARLPQPDTDSHEDGRFYSFDVADVHFVSILVPSEGPQLQASDLAWIESDLQAARAEGAKWIVPYMHAPLYSEGTAHTENLRVRDQLAPLFEEFEVDLVISAHDQSYERTFPLRNASSVSGPDTNLVTSADADTYFTESDGIVWMKVSPGGKVSNSGDDFSQWRSDTPPDYTAVRDNTMHHYAELDFDPSGELHVRVFGVTGDGSLPSVVDEFTFVQGDELTF